VSENENIVEFESNPPAYEVLVGSKNYVNTTLK